MRALCVIVFICLFFLFACSDEKDFSNLKRKQISSDTWQSFNEFSFLNKNSWGDVGSYYGTKPQKIPNEYKNLYFGLDDESYEYFETMGDGNCWIRAYIRALFYYLFSKETSFLNFMEEINRLENKVPDDAFFHPLIKDIHIGSPFMKGFPWEEFKKGLYLLKTVSEKERLEILNHHNVDWFFIASFRALQTAMVKIVSLDVLELGFDFKKRQFLDGDKIKYLWQNLIDERKTSLLKITNKLKEAFKYANNRNFLAAKAWGDPLSFSYLEHDNFFRLGPREPICLFAFPFERDEYSCLGENGGIKFIPIFFNSLSQAMPIFVNNNHYGVVIRKPNAQFDWDGFYFRIEDNSLITKIKHCINSL